MKAQIVSFHCVLKNKLGQVLGSSFNQDVINQLETHDRYSEQKNLRGLVAGLQNVSSGEKRQLSIPAIEAYGVYDPDLVLNVLRSDLIRGDQLMIGSELMSQPSPGAPSRAYRVVQIQGETLVLDSNHPLAGQDLIFDIDIVTAREACSDDFEEPDLSAVRKYLH